MTDVEEACREPEEQRALRTLDWMSVRIGKRCEKWVQDIEERGEATTARPGDRLRTPWWDELRRCAEGDIVPEKDEGWNHPVAGNAYRTRLYFGRWLIITSYSGRFDNVVESTTSDS